MDLFFEVWRELKYDFLLSRVVKSSLWEGITIKIYSADGLAVSVQQDDLDYEYAYLIAARDLIAWARRNEDHAKSSTIEDENKWMEKLKAQLGLQGEEYEINNAAERWEMLSLPAVEE